MSIGIVDTTVILHYFRQNAAARAWVDAQPARLSVTSMTWLEVMAGASSKANQAESKSILGKFELIYLTTADQQWAMEQLERFQFSHHIGVNDCLIASAAHRLRLPLYTHNLKDMTPLIGSLAVQPMRDNPLRNPAPSTASKSVCKIAPVAPTRRCPILPDPRFRNRRPVSAKRS